MTGVRPPNRPHDAADETTDEEWQQQVELIHRMNMAGALPVTFGNEIEIVMNGGVFDWLNSEIPRADGWVGVAVFDWYDDETSREFADTLGKAREQGRPVAAVVDSVGGFKAPVRYMLEKGVDVRIFHPMYLTELFRLARRSEVGPPRIVVDINADPPRARPNWTRFSTYFQRWKFLYHQHMKIFFLSDRIHGFGNRAKALIPGSAMKLAWDKHDTRKHKGAMREFPAKFDGGVALQGPCVAQIADVFDSIYNEAIPVGFRYGKLFGWISSTDRSRSVNHAHWSHVRDPLPVAHPDGQPLTGGIQIVASGPTYDRNQPTDSYLATVAAIDSAKEEIIWLTPVTNTPPEVIAALDRAASKGVNVVMVTNGDDMEWDFIYRKSNSKYPELMNAGVRIEEVQGFELHWKALLVDKVMVRLGSDNGNERSIKEDREIHLNVYHKPIINQVAKIIFELRRDHCRPIDPETFAALPRTIRQVAGDVLTRGSI